MQIMVMETYHRKRSKEALAVTKMECHQKAAEPLAEQGGLKDEGMSLFLGRHHLVLPPPTSDRSAPLLKGGGDDKNEDDMQNHIQVGGLYEIDHIHLPPRAPVQLRSIRVAMVCEKTKLDVVVRFPSMASLRAFFSYSKRETHPALDEKFVMELALSRKVLRRLVSAQNFSEQKSFEDFWLINASVSSFGDKEDGDCLSELKCNGMVRWGIRRQVKYLGRHKISDGDNDDNVNAQNSSSSFVSGFEEKKMELRGGGNREFSGEEEGHEDSDDEWTNGKEIVKEKQEETEGNEGEEMGEEDDEEDNEEDAEEKEEKIPRSGRDLKRKRYTSRNISVKKPKDQKIKIRNRKQIDNKKNQVKRNKNGTRFKEARVLRNPKERWSAERYKLAEHNLLEVMKAKEATAEKPLLRPQLRAEARKRIGDTGLLDHLLKHMAGKLAPGGKERFRRRHNADGAMEYWLESADLVNLRRDAGITDPFWIPPLGWKPGDSPTQDPICAKEIKLLKDDISKVKRDVELMVTKKQLEEEILNLRRELDQLSCKRKQEENQTTTLISSSSMISQELDKPIASLEMYREQLMAISEFVKEVKNNIGKLLALNEEERVRTDFLLEPNSRQPQAHEISKMGDERPEFGAKRATSSPLAEQKAAKIQRLKSGFRICKPQGTFLWPNMVKNNPIASANMSPQPDQDLVQIEVPTPPSVSSSTGSASPQLHYLHHLPPPQPVKPVAERGAVTISVSTVPKDARMKDDGATTSTMINLNKVPSISHHDNPLVSPAANTKRRKDCA